MAHFGGPVRGSGAHCWLAGWLLAGLAGPGLREYAPGRVLDPFPGLTNNQSTRLQATKLQDYRTTSYQTARLEVYKDYIDT